MRIGFIGLGTMGLPMATNLAKEHDVLGYDRSTLDETPSFAIANTVDEVIEGTDIFITMLPEDSVLETVYDNIKTLIKPNQIWVDMSTVSHAFSVKMHQRLKTHDATYIDAPVVKSRPQAIEGTLGIYVGGEQEVITKLDPIFKLLGEDIIYMGKGGNGIVMKLLHNMLVGYIQYGVNHMLHAASTLGIDHENILKGINAGGGQNFYLDGKGKSIQAKDYSVKFSAANMKKDLRLIDQLIKDNSLPNGAIEKLKEVYAMCEKLSMLDKDFSVSYEAFKTLKA